MTPEQFIAKWENSTLKERSASQSHFNDLCSVLGVENPIDADQKGEWYCFERGASKTAGGEGWADVWKKGHFGWEYKGKRKDLKAAFAQLQQYAVALDNPPLLVVSDMDRIIVHTNWTNTVSETHEIKLAELTNPHKRELLRWVFLDPNRLKPQKTIDALTREVADKFASLALRLHERGFDPKVVAHFVNRLVFCMFAEDINLLPRQLFTQILDKSHTQPALSEKLFSQLFASMRKGGLFGIDEIKWFNGGLFDDATAIPLTRDELKLVGQAAALDWTDIDPSIFGTLFERGLDPAKRSQLGAHYTDPEKIMMIVRPVIIEPLWAEWEAVKETIQKPRTGAKRKQELLNGFLERLKTFRVLDPACGSGNFLYLALLALKDIEHRVNLDAEALGFGKQLPTVGPEAVLGIELNPYAAELARVSIWIGEIQWMRKNGYGVSERPILKSLDNIENRDALLNPDGTEATWPKADVAIGNPPFLGNKKMMAELGEDYVQTLRTRYAPRVSGGVDLVTYWFDKAWRAIKGQQLEAAGFVSTNSIRGGANRTVISPIAEQGGIFEAWDDEEWTVDGAAVRVSLMCFKQTSATQNKLNGQPVSKIFSDLTASVSGTDITSAKRLAANRALSFQGPVKVGAFDIPGELARQWLKLPINPNGRPNSDVLFPWANGMDIVRRPADKWIIDFG
ncbi:class I SAM-dependent DNA methyltransferase, partial [Rhodococcus erythropolis]